MRRTLLFLLPFLSMLCSGSPAAAQTRLFITPCSSFPCQNRVSVHIDQVATARLPWLASVIVPGGVCFALDTGLGSDADVRFSVIAPNGTVWRGGNFVEVRTPISGWYTVQLDSYPPAREQIATLRLELRAYTSGTCTLTPPR